MKLVLLSLLLFSSCRPRRDLSQYSQEDPRSNLVSTIAIGNPQFASQLKSGFYQVEEGGWRWASGTFTVELRAPFASQKLGAILTLKANLPDILYSKTGPIEMSAKLNQTKLPKMLFDKSGEAIYKVEISPAAMSADQIVVEFKTDKFLPPNTFPNDGRELAMIVSTISLETKK